MSSVDLGMGNGVAVGVDLKGPSPGSVWGCRSLARPYDHHFLSQWPLRLSELDLSLRNHTCLRLPRVPLEDRQDDVMSAGRDGQFPPRGLSCNLL